MKKGKLEKLITLDIVAEKSLFCEFEKTLEKEFENKIQIYESSYNEDAGFLKIKVCGVYEEALPSWDPYSGGDPGYYEEEYDVETDEIEEFLNNFQMFHDRSLFDYDIDVEESEIVDDYSIEEDDYYESLLGVFN